jgi:putative ABC transport system permease protein
MALSALNRKLARDLWGMKGPALAIALVVAAGVAMNVMYLANFASLRDTRAAYYHEQHFADVFVSLVRAPRWVAERLAAVPGVSAVEARVVTDVTLAISGFDEPATARLISVPSDGPPRLNQPVLRKGRWIERGSDEVLASEAFVDAHGLAPGDSVRVVINGRSRQLSIVGVALSPEYVYSIRPGEIVPDPRRFGVFWMDEHALGAAFDMESAFNDAALALGPGASLEAVLDAVDQVLEPYGGRGAIPRALQLSHWTLESELEQLRSIGFLLPAVFLAVAAFILNVALGRALSMQRPQLACLKALGYSNASVGWHYLKWALAIGLAGALLGIAGGVGLGRMLVRIYNDFFRFPELSFEVPLDVVAGATGLTLLSAGAGALSVVRRAVRLPPAEAMRPEAPPRYRRSWFEAPLVARHLSGEARMILRHLFRHPLRTSAAVFGVAFAVAVLMVGLVFNGAIEHLIQTQFWDVQREDVTLRFVEPRAGGVEHELSRLPGVLAVEPQRSVAARLVAGHRDRYLAVTGVPELPLLSRVVDRAGRPAPMPPSGLVISRVLARVLDLGPGERVRIEVLEGARPARSVQVTGVVDDILGVSAYMNMAELHALMREGRVASGALLSIDSADDSRLAAELRLIPGVAGVAFKRAMLATFRDVMAANMNVTIFINFIFAGIIAFGVVYNAARISLSERSRELSSLRVLGFTRAEVSLILLGELAVVTLLALPLGGVLGYGLAAGLVRSVESEVYRFPLHVTRQAVATSFVGILAASLVSGLLVRRQLDRLDLVAVLKSRE